MLIKIIIFTVNRVIIMIQFKYNIENINEYQCGNLPQNSIKLKTPATEEIQKKAFPIAVVLCAVMFITMFFKTFSKSYVCD